MSRALYARLKAIEVSVCFGFVAAFCRKIAIYQTFE
jgi:hypothetical protein